jgi:hypothetical protein
MYLFELLQELVKYDSGMLVFVGCEGRLLDYDDIFVECGRLIIASGTYPTYSKTVGELRQALANFHDQVVYGNEGFVLFTVRSVVQQLEGVVVEID